MEQLPSSCEEVIWLPKVDSEVAGWGTLIVWRHRVCLVSHSLTVLSCPPETMVVSLTTATERIWSVWPVNECISLPVCTSESLSPESPAPPDNK